MRATLDAMGRLEQRLGALLRAGVTASAVVLIAGLAIWMIQPDRPLSAGLLQAGLFMLMATPMIRVVVSLAGYVRMRDWLFVATTAAVLVELGLSVASALGR
jgi:uncharacterized membrane protein